MLTVQISLKYTGKYMEYQGKMFLNIEKVLVKINEDQT